MRQIERLSNFYTFDSEVLANIEAEAHRQQEITWPEYERRYNIPRPEVFQPLDGKPIEVISIRPKDFDDVVVYHQPMACALDSNISLHIATLAGTLPDKWIIGVGNPGQPGRGYGKLSIADSIRVMSDDLRPVVAPSLEYLNAQNINSAAHAGESYGADKAAASAEHAFRYGSEATTAIMVEPVSVVKSGLIKMGLTFQKTGKHAERYLKPVRDQSQTFVSAEELRGSMIGYAIGLGRLSNLAIGKALGEQGFEGRLERALLANARLKTGLSWGTASEFDPANQRENVARRLRLKYGRRRVLTMPLKNQTHAMNLDIFLNAAIISQMLAEAS